MKNKNFFTGYLTSTEDMDTANELARQHNIGLLKGFAIAVISFIIVYIINFFK